MNHCRTYIVDSFITAPLWFLSQDVGRIGTGSAAGEQPILDNSYMCPVQMSSSTSPTLKPHYHCCHSLISGCCDGASGSCLVKGFIYRNCTSNGWSDPYPPYEEACAFEDDSESGTVTNYLSTLKQLYTAGYATSLISLITAVIIFTCFR
ncbi:hypothetical protein cypCar_00014099 [Cyprinus carpio]|nr:hypothetical protein cypCar_00014099 [Cyprinus carpio]